MMLNFLFGYHGFSGNKVHVIGANLIFQIYTPFEKKWNLKKKNNYVKDLWKYDSILTIQKSLIKIWLWFLREDFHMKSYYLILHHILSHYR
jgi:hypothetical protein